VPLDVIVLYFILLVAPTNYRAGVLDPPFPSADGFILKQRSTTAWQLGSSRQLEVHFFCKCRVHKDLHYPEVFCEFSQERI